MYADEMLPVLEALARRAAEAERLGLAWLELKRQGGSWVLRVFIERPAELVPSEGDVGLSDCEKMTHRLGLLLDVEDPIDCAYTLEVSTPGLDRPLRRPEDYRRFAGRLARLRTRELVNGRRRFLGRLSGVERETVLLTETDSQETGAELRIPLAVIESGRLEVELDSPAAPSRRARKH